VTDLEEFVSLMHKFGVGLDRSQSFKPNLRPKEVSLEIVEMCEGNDKVTGYPCFCTRFEFTPEGGFVKMGAWE